MLNRLLSKLKNKLTETDAIQHDTTPAPSPVTTPSMITLADIPPPSPELHPISTMDVPLEVEECGCKAVVTETGEIDFCGLMLEQTIESHRAWIEQLRDVLGGKIPEAYSPEVIGSETGYCKLGDWLHNEARCLAKYPEYAVVADVHRAFHECAAEIVRLHQKQHFADAVMMLRTQLAALSEELEASLVRLHEQSQAAKQNGDDCGCS